MSRPEKYNTPKRNHKVTVRLNEEEKAQLEYMCEKSQKSKESYIRTTMFLNKPVIKEITVQQVDLEGMKELISQIGKIGSNINQIARAYNQGSEFKEDLKKELAELQKLRFQIIEILEKNYK